MKRTVYYIEKSNNPLFLWEFSSLETRLGSASGWWSGEFKGSYLESITKKNAIEADYQKISKRKAKYLFPELF